MQSKRAVEAGILGAGALALLFLGLVVLPRLDLRARRELPPPLELTQFGNPHGSAGSTVPIPASPVLAAHPAAHGTASAASPAGWAASPALAAHLAAHGAASAASPAGSAASPVLAAHGAASAASPAGWAASPVLAAHLAADGAASPPAPAGWAVSPVLAAHLAADGAASAASPAGSAASPAPSASRPSVTATGSASAGTELPAVSAQAQAATEWIRVGLQLRRAGRFEQALEAFAAALRSDPDNLRALINLAVVYDYDLHDRVRAIELYERIVRIAPPGSGLAGLEPRIRKLRAEAS